MIFGKTFLVLFFIQFIVIEINCSWSPPPYRSRRPYITTRSPRYPNYSFYTPSTTTSTPHYGYGYRANWRDLTKEQISISCVDEFPVVQGSSIRSTSAITVSKCDVTEFSSDVFLQVRNLDDFVYEECKIATGDFGQTGGLKLLQFTNNTFVQSPIPLSIDANGMKGLVFTKNQINVESFDLKNPTDLEFIILTDSEIPNFSKNLLINSTQLKIVELTSINLTSVESIELPNSVKWLDLSHNNITQLNNGSFHGDLQFMQLDGNQIHQVKPNAFEQLSDLLVLSLKNNNISNLSKEMFSGVQNKLEILDLSENPITEIDSQTFENVTSLRKINLSEGKLKIIDLSAFIYTPKLEHLNLSNNQIESLVYTKKDFNVNFNSTENNSKLHWILDVYSSKRFFYEKTRNFYSDPDKVINPHHLQGDSPKILDLSKNQLTSIESEIFENFQNINSVKLSHNPIKSVHKRSFAGMNHLEFLYLDHCDLEFIDFTTFSILTKLFTLDLAFNRLQVIDYSIIPLPVFTIHFLSLKNNQLTSFPFKKANLPNMKYDMSLNIENNNNLTCDNISEDLKYVCSSNSV